MSLLELKNRFAGALIRGVVAPLWAAWERSPCLRIAESLRRRERLSRAERHEEQCRALKRIVELA
ncbi:MAG: hypothetical protein ACUVYA_14970 [Planctomycetota bacterium]